MMKAVPQYKFHKTKYGEELLIDVVTLDSIRHYIDRHPIHTLTYFDITFITGGEGHFTLDSETYALCPGDVVFSRPGEIRAWEANRPLQGYALIFDEEFILSFFNDPAFIQNLAYFSPNRASAKTNINNIRPCIGRLIRNIADEINRRPPKDKHLLRALLYEILTRLNREYVRSHTDVPKVPRNRHIDRFIRLVELNYKTRHDTKYYADELCITPNYLNEITKKSIGIPPKRYVQNRIIREAKTSLAYTGHSISEIAEQLNFESPSYFIRLFRSQTGLTPLQYRKNKNR